VRQQCGQRRIGQLAEVVGLPIPAQGVFLDD
jgi:hypothetical protein